MNSKEMMKLLERFKETNYLIMKQNLKNKCKEIGKRKQLAEKTGIEIGVFQSCLNPAHKTSLTFENLIKICGKLDIDIEDIFQDTTIKKSNRGASAIWNKQNKKDFINIFERKNIQEVRKRYNLTEKTATYYYNKFKKEMGI